MRMLIKWQSILKQTFGCLKTSDPPSNSIKNYLFQYIHSEINLIFSRVKKVSISKSWRFIPRFSHLGPAYISTCGVIDPPSSIKIEKNFWVAVSRKSYRIMMTNVLLLMEYWLWSFNFGVKLGSLWPKSKKIQDIF